uniref:Uncharacterized protein n=1 Tax=Oryza punctata TaxID=4537 RepID=A0A0E0LHZ6_ORYPU
MLLEVLLRPPPRQADLPLVAILHPPTGSSPMRTTPPSSPSACRASPDSVSILSTCLSGDIVKQMLIPQPQVGKAVVVSATSSDLVFLDGERKLVRIVKTLEDRYVSEIITVSDDIDGQWRKIEIHHYTLIGAAPMELCSKGLLTST